MKRWKSIRRYAMRFDGEGGGGSSAAGSETTPAPAEVAPNASTSVENGASAIGTQTQTAQEPTKPFKAFASQSEFDQFVQQTLKSREESLRAKLTPEIKAQLDKESKMTAEQKVQAQLDEIAQQKAELAKEKNRIKAESLLVSKGITDEVSRSTMLDSVVVEDETETLKRAQTLIDAVEKAANEKVKAAMKQVKTPTSAGPTKADDDSSVKLAKAYAKQRATARKASSDVFAKYLGQK